MIKWVITSRHFFSVKMKKNLIKKKLHTLDKVRGKPVTWLELGRLAIGLYNGFDFCFCNELSKRKFDLDFPSCTARDLWQKQTLRNPFEGSIFHWICRTSMLWQRDQHLLDKWECWLFPGPTGNLLTDPILGDSVLTCESRTNTWMPAQINKRAQFTKEDKFTLLVLN